jgi:hypothetical protein
VTEESQDLLENKALKALREQKDLRDQTEKLVQLVRKERRAKSDHLVLLAILVDLERKVIKDSKEEMEHLAAKENGEKMAFKEKEDSLVLVDSEVE